MIIEIYDPDDEDKARYPSLYPDHPQSLYFMDSEDDAEIGRFFAERVRFLVSQGYDDATILNFRIRRGS